MENNISNISEEKLVDLIAGDDTIDIDSMVGKLNEMNERKQFLSQHKHAITFEESRNLWKTYLPDPSKPEGRRRITSKSRKELHDKIIDFYKNEHNKVTFLDIQDAWIRKKYELGNISMSTKNRYEADSKRYLGELRDMNIRSVTPKILRDALENIVANEHPSQKAFSGIKTVVNGVISFARREGYLHFYFAEVLEDLQVSKRSFKKTIKEDSEDVFTDEEYNRLLEGLRYSDHPKDICLVLTALTGCRIGEITTARHRDFNGNVLKVRNTQTRWKDEDGIYHYDVKNFPKTEAGVRDVIIPKDYTYLIDKVKALNPDNEYVFVDQNGKPFSCNVMNNHLKKRCIQLGIPPKSPHKLRKAVASIFINNGADTRMITTLLGHTDIKTTEMYYHRNMKDADTMSNIISDMEPFKIAGKDISDIAL